MQITLEERIQKEWVLTCSHDKQVYEAKQT